MKLSLRDNIMIWRACRLANYETSNRIEISKLIKRKRDYARIANLIQANYFCMPYETPNDFKQDKIQISEIAINAAELFTDDLFNKLLWSIVIPVFVSLLTTSLTLLLKK